LIFTDQAEKRRLEHTDQWEQRKFTTSLLKEWNTSTEAYKKTIFMQFPPRPAGTDTTISTEDARRLAVSYSEFDAKECGQRAKMDTDECRGLKRRIETRDALIGFLNYLEYLAISYQEKTVVRPIFRQSLGG